MGATSSWLRAECARRRELGWTYRRIARELQDRHGANARAAYRLSHGWTQEQAARRWNERWPEDPSPKVGKNFSYWETWPGRGGRQPSARTLERLAELYHCRPGDLVDGRDFGEAEQGGPGGFAPPSTRRAGRLRYRHQDAGTSFSGDGGSETFGRFDPYPPSGSSGEMTDNGDEQGSPAGGQQRVLRCDCANDPYCTYCVGGPSEIVGWVSQRQAVMVHQPGSLLPPDRNRAA